MATCRELIYNIKEGLKDFSDDQFLTEEYIKHLIHLKREYLMHQKFSDYRNPIPESVKQTIEFEIEEEERVLGLPGDYVLVSKQIIPAISNLDRNIGMSILTGRDVLESYLNLIPYERFLHVGKDKWLKNQVYGAFRDNRLYLKSGNMREKGIAILNLTSVFSNPEEAYQMSPRFSYSIAFEDIEYPLPNRLADTATTMIVAELIQKLQVREDARNNASPN